MYWSQSNSFKDSPVWLNLVSFPGSVEQYAEYHISTFLCLHLCARVEGHVYQRPGHKQFRQIFRRRSKRMLVDNSISTFFSTVFLHCVFFLHCVSWSRLVLTVGGGTRPPKVPLAKAKPPNVKIRHTRLMNRSHKELESYEWGLQRAR